MTEYVPTTDEVRIKYRHSSGRNPGGYAEFDRWLAEHDAALVEKLADGINGRSGGQQESWLRARAAEIREGDHA